MLTQINRKHFSCVTDARAIGNDPKGPKIEKSQSHLKFSVSLAFFNLGLQNFKFGLQNSPHKKKRGLVGSSLEIFNI